MFQIDNVLRQFRGVVLLIAMVATAAYGEVVQPENSNEKSNEKSKSVTAVASKEQQQAASDLARLLSPLHYMQASFSQHTLEVNGKRVQESEGVMTVQRPNLFRWEVKKPFPQMIVSNGEKVWQHEIDLAQVTIQTLDARINTTPALILSGETTEINQNFRVAESTKDGLSLFDLMPKGDESLFENLQLAFRGKILKTMTLTDALGAKTRIEFSNISSSKKQRLASKDFELSIPPGVDVIDEEHNEH
ncbi:MAG: outer membrane lipoprotein chaperone LolA [Endozoicomonadaceae bacterium]|nr:outer membrane lipoprotein chaperone LolA [Endozoicomonadaceae bacterium]